MSDLERFRPLAYAIAKDFFLPGADVDDVRQEAMIGVFKALRDYRPDRGTLRSFVELCVRRQIITAVKVANQLNRRALSESVSTLSTPDGDVDAVDLLPAHGVDPARIVEDRERLAELLDAIAHNLSPLERRVLIAFANGHSYAEIAEVEGVERRARSCRNNRSGRTTTQLHAKAIDNALQRARHKLTDPPTVLQAA